MLPLHSFVACSMHAGVMALFCRLCSVQIRRVNSNSTAATDRQEVHHHVSRLRFAYSTRLEFALFFAGSPRFSTHSLGKTSISRSKAWLKAKGTFRNPNAPLALRSPDSSPDCPACMLDRAQDSTSPSDHYGTNFRPGVHWT